MGPFSLEGRTALLTGGYGVLGTAMAAALARAGARVALLGRRDAEGRAAAEAMRAKGFEAVNLVADVLDRASLEAARDRLEADWGAPDILVNAAGGNRPGAVVPPTGSFFDVDEAEMRRVVELNFDGTLIPTLIFGAAMAARGAGCVVNISSVSAVRPLTRVVGYSAAKTAIDSFTKWLAVELAVKHGEGIRVNAIRPGFFLAEQNRTLLTNPDGSLTERGRLIVEHTPMRRFGRAEELGGALVWLCSDAASFVTGTVVEVDGGFGAFAGV